MTSEIAGTGNQKPSLARKKNDYIEMSQPLSFTKRRKRH